jgi:hypothetical protein
MEIKMLKNRINRIVIALVLTLTIAIPIAALPITSSQLPTRPTYAYIGAVPNPIGVGQEVLIHVGITQPLENYWMGWEGLTITVTKPDGTKQTLGPFSSLSPILL